MEQYGAYDYPNQFDVAACDKDAMLMRIAGETPNTQRIIIATESLGWSKKDREGLTRGDIYAVGIRRN